MSVWTKVVDKNYSPCTEKYIYSRFRPELVQKMYQTTRSAHDLKLQIYQSPCVFKILTNRDSFISLILSL